MGVIYYTGKEALTYVRECARLHSAAFSPLGARGWTANEFESLLRRGSTFLLKADHGFLLADLIADEVEILTVVVAPDHQGQSIGRALMSKLDETCRCRNVYKSNLEVAEDNNAAISLYIAFNYKQLAIRDGYFKRKSGAVAALVMTKLYNDL